MLQRLSQCVSRRRDRRAETLQAKKFFAHLQWKSYLRRWRRALVLAQQRKARIKHCLQAWYLRQLQQAMSAWQAELEYVRRANKFFDLFRRQFGMSTKRQRWGQLVLYAQSRKERRQRGRTAVYAMASWRAAAVFERLRARVLQRKKTAFWCRQCQAHMNAWRLQVALSRWSRDARLARRDKEASAVVKRHRQDRMERQIVHAWREYTRWRRFRASQHKAATAACHKKLTRRSFDQFLAGVQEAKQQIVRGETARTFCQAIKKRQGLQRWRSFVMDMNVRRQQVENSLQLERSMLLTRVFDGWTRYTRHRKHAALVKANADAAASLRRKLFHWRLWKTETRNFLKVKLHRKAKTVALLRRCLKEFAGVVRRAKYLQEVALHVRHQHMKRWLSRMRQAALVRFQQRQAAAKLLAASVSFDVYSATAEAMSRWRSVTYWWRLTADATQLHCARLTSSSFSQWRRVASQQRQMKAAASRVTAAAERRVRKAALQRWLSAYADRNREATMMRASLGALKHPLQAAAFRGWRSYLARRRRTWWFVQRVFAPSLLHRYFFRLLQAVHRRRRLNRLASIVRVKQAHRVRSRVLRKWNRRSYMSSGLSAIQRRRALRYKHTVLAAWKGFTAKAQEKKDAQSDFFQRLSTLRSPLPAEQAAFAAAPAAMAPAHEGENLGFSSSSTFGLPSWFARTAASASARQRSWAPASRGPSSRAVFLAKSLVTKHGGPGITPQASRFRPSKTLQPQRPFQRVSSRPLTGPSSTWQRSLWHSQEDPLNHTYQMHHTSPSLTVQDLEAADEDDYEEEELENFRRTHASQARSLSHSQTGMFSRSEFFQHSLRNTGRDPPSLQQQGAEGKGAEANEEGQGEGGREEEALLSTQRLLYSEAIFDELVVDITATRFQLASVELLPLTFWGEEHVVPDNGKDAAATALSMNAAVCLQRWRSWPLAPAWNAWRYMARRRRLRRQLFHLTHQLHALKFLAKGFQVFGSNAVARRHARMAVAYHRQVLKSRALMYWKRRHQDQQRRNRQVSVAQAFARAKCQTLAFKALKEQCLIQRWPRQQVCEFVVSMKHHHFC